MGDGGEKGKGTTSLDENVAAMCILKQGATNNKQQTLAVPSMRQDMRIAFRIVPHPARHPHCPPSVPCSAGQPGRRKQASCRWSGAPQRWQRDWPWGRCCCCLLRRGCLQQAGHDKLATVTSLRVYYSGVFASVDRQANKSLLLLVCLCKTSRACHDKGTANICRPLCPSAGDFRGAWQAAQTCAHTMQKQQDVQYNNSFQAQAQRETHLQAESPGRWSPLSARR